MWVENVSMKAIQKGDHYLDENTILIQIQDWDFEKFSHVKYKDKFKAIYRFKFDYTNEDTNNAISDRQAEEIANILLKCLDNKWSIVVHCHAGICRSGGVAEVAEMLGFEYAGSHKIPNLRVKRMIIEQLNNTAQNESIPLA